MDTISKSSPCDCEGSRVATGAKRGMLVCTWVSHFPLLAKKQAGKRLFASSAPCVSLPRRREREKSPASLGVVEGGVVGVWGFGFSPPPLPPPLSASPHPRFANQLE